MVGVEQTSLLLAISHRVVSFKKEDRKKVFDAWELPDDDLLPAADKFACKRPRVPGDTPLSADEHREMAEYYDGKRLGVSAATEAPSHTWDSQFLTP